MHALINVGCVSRFNDAVTLVVSYQVRDFLTVVRGGEQFRHKYYVQDVPGLKRATTDFTTVLNSSAFSSTS